MENAARRIWRKSLPHNDLDQMPTANIVPNAKKSRPSKYRAKLFRKELFSFGMKLYSRKPKDYAWRLKCRLYNVDIRVENRRKRKKEKKDGKEL